MSDSTLPVPNQDKLPTATEADNTIISCRADRIGFLQRSRERLAYLGLPLKQTLLQLLASYGLDGAAAEVAVKQAGWNPQSVFRLLAIPRQEILNTRVAQLDDTLKSYVASVGEYVGGCAQDVILRAELLGLTSSQAPDVLPQPPATAARHHPAVRKLWKDVCSSDTDISWKEILEKAYRRNTERWNYFSLTPLVDKMALEAAAHIVPLNGDSILPLPWLKLLVLEALRHTYKGKPHRLFQVHGSISDWFALLNLIEKQSHQK